jgi:hypothetical protein
MKVVLTEKDYLAIIIDLLNQKKEKDPNYI